MELKTPMVFVKHINAAQRGDPQSIQYLCERTSGQFVKICRKHDLSDSEIEAVLGKAYGLIFADIKSVRNPQTFMSWAGGIVEDCCAEAAGLKATSPKVKTAAFYDENAYLQPSETYYAEVNYADEKAIEENTPDNRLIAVDELVYRPDAKFEGSESAATTDEQSAGTGDNPDASVPDPSVIASIPTFASSYEEEAVFQDALPAAEKPADENEMPEETAPGDEPMGEPEETAPDDEPDIDLVEEEEDLQVQDEADIGVNDSENDGEDEDSEDESTGLAFRTKVLIGLLCVFVFGACVGIGYAISKGMTSRNISADASGVVVTQADSIGETESLQDSLLMSSVESPAGSSGTESGISREAAGNANNHEADTADTAGGQASGMPSDDPAGGQAAEPQAGDPAAGTGGEVTARADIASYLGGTFASVFRDYPDIPRSMYRGVLSLVDANIGFLGSYDATEPVSSTIVESVSLLGESGDYNINGFYIGMSAQDAESLAAASGYTALEMTAESSREYVDTQDNTLSLTIDGGVVKNVTLRSAAADNVTMETADEVTDEVLEEIPGEEGGVG